MRRYLLGTNIISDLIRNPSGKVAQRIDTVGENAVCTSAIVAAELRYGAEKTHSNRIKARVDEILSLLDIIPFSPPADVHYARLRNYLTCQGQIIGPNDILIAAQALALGLTLVTANRREFSRVPDLKLENWL